MQPVQQIEAREKIILFWQYTAFFIGLILFLPVSSFFSMKYGLLVFLVMVIYISISSIKNRLSIIRPKGRLAHSKGPEAFTLGMIMLVISLIMIAVTLLFPMGVFSF